MKKTIVITSIFSPTEAVLKFSKLEEYNLIVVGDKKTPEDWSCDNVIYLSLEKQNTIGIHLNKVLPFNHYCRKMLGYLHALQNGAEFIVDTDDDNIPKENWLFPEFNGEFDEIKKNEGFVNIYQLYSKQNIWPRGLPLRLITTKFKLEEKIEPSNCKIGVWQGLADEDPDVDAIYRLTSDEPCSFIEREPIVLGKGTISPFNTQNTMMCKELFPLMYLPTYVTFRFTDILRGLIAQPIMWLYGFQLGFINATVVQVRNPHDYMKDFISELPMYEHCEKVVEIVTNSITKEDTITKNLINAYNALFENNIVCEKELVTLNAWVKDFEHISLINNELSLINNELSIINNELSIINKLLSVKTNENSK